MTNQKIKIEELNFPPVWDEHGREVSPEELARDMEGVKTQEADAPFWLDEPGTLSPEEHARHNSLAVLEIMRPAFSREEWKQWSGKAFSLDNMAAIGELTAEFNKRQVESLKAHFEQMSRRGQMSLEEWSWPVSWFAGCQAILCELSPGFDLNTISNLGDYQMAAFQAIKSASEAGTHAKTDALRGAMSEPTKAGELWRLFARCDAALGASEKWRVSTLEKVEFQEKHPDGYTLRDFIEFAKEQRRFIESKRMPREKMPAILAQCTFIEGRAFAAAIGDGRDGRHWEEIQGALALLHRSPKAKHSTRFEPNALLLGWWGTSGAQIETLHNELARLDFDDVILFHVVLSAILHSEKARFSVPLDGLIKLIGRDSDARRSTAAREQWRRKVWRSIVLFDSLAVYGTRPGKWREPGTKGEKRDKMSEQTLYSCDPLIRIVGTRDTEQGTFDGSAPPKEVSIVPGDWLMPFHGNREVLSELGNVLQLAQIARGKPSGAWAVCAGLMLNQLWREEATRAQKTSNSRTVKGQEIKVEVLKFRTFTRRELLAGTLRSDYGVHAILSDPTHAPRARGYWDGAVKELKKAGVIGYYAEGKARAGESWREVWLDQPLTIRPTGETLENALAIHKSAETAKRRGKARKTPQKAPANPNEGDG